MMTNILYSELADLWHCEQWRQTPLLASKCNHILERECTYHYDIFICKQCGYYYDYERQECEVI